jgi:hypothetical protein
MFCTVVVTVSVCFFPLFSIAGSPGASFSFCSFFTEDGETVEDSDESDILPSWRRFLAYRCLARLLPMKQ